MMRKFSLAGLFLSVFFTLYAGDVPEEKNESIQAMPPVSWLDLPLRVDTGKGAGVGDSEFPRMAVNGNDVGIVWSDSRFGQTDILFNRSRDRGATWRTFPVRLDTGEADGLHGSWDASICRSGNHVYVTWSDERNGMADIYFNRSTDGGDTWLPSPVRLDTGDAPGAGESWLPQICCDGTRVYVTWFDERIGANGIYFNRSLDGGGTWMAAGHRLDTGGTEIQAILPWIACAGDNVYVTWMSDLVIEDYGIYFNRSLDAGATWMPAEVRLDAGESLSLFPMIAVSGNYVYVTWIEWGGLFSLDGNVYLNRSADRGSTWLPAAVRVDADDFEQPSFVTEPPLIQCAGAEVAVVWRATRWLNSPFALNASTSAFSPSFKRRDMRSFRIDLEPSTEAIGPILAAGEVLFNRSLDGGLTWQAEDTCLNTDPGATPTGFVVWSLSTAAFCSRGDDFHVAWSGGDGDYADVLFVHSGDRGATWQTPELRLDTGDAPGSHDSLFPCLSCTDVNVFAAWMDDRNDGFDIYYSTTETPPRADAGTGGEARVGRAFPLDGSGSFDRDRDGLAYLWSMREQPSGSTAVIDNHHGQLASFVPDLEGEYSIQLTVTDPFGQSDWERISITALDLVDLTLTCTSGGTTSPAPGIHTYKRGETVTVTAVPDPDFLFAGWSGDASGTANPLSLVMDDDKTVTATFVPVVFPPLNLSGESIENRSLSMVEYIARLTWAANPDNYDITGYRVTRVESGNEVELGVTGPDTFVYEEMGVPGDGALTYRIYTLRADGFQSDPAEVTIN